MYAAFDMKKRKRRVVTVTVTGEQDEALDRLLVTRLHRRKPLERPVTRAGVALECFVVGLRHLDPKDPLTSGLGPSRGTQTRENPRWSSIQTEGGV
jgi:hypothetical protein